MKIEIQKDLPVSPEDFYDYMIDEIRKQIENELGRDVDPDELQPGLKLKRKQKDRKGNVTSSRYSIRHNQRPEKFTALITSLNQKSMLSYRFEPSEKGCLFTYVVDIRPNDPGREPTGAKAKFAEFQKRASISSSISNAVNECQKQTARRQKKQEKEHRKARRSEKSEKSGGFFRKP